MSDTVILATIVIIFVGLGAVLPFIHAAFDQTISNTDQELIEFKSGQGFSTNQVSVLGIVVSIFTMFFWTFGNINAVLDLVIFVPLRIIFVVLLFKLVRGVGG